MRCQINIDISVSVNYNDNVDCVFYIILLHLFLIAKEQTMV